MLDVIDVMIDIETLGTQPGSVITQIAAVAHGADYDFVQKIAVSSALRYKLSVDADTLSWWNKQSEEAWNAATLGGEPLGLVLKSFADFLAKLRKGSDESATGRTLRVWGDGANFDITLLECAYRACSLPIPWVYKEVNCYRTLRNVLDSKKPAAKVAHDALSDARAQCVHLREMLATIKDSTL